MKLLASRVERDQDDIRKLYELCGFTTAQEGLRLVEAAYPGYVIPRRTRFMLDEMYPLVNSQLRSTNTSNTVAVARASVGKASD